MQPGCMCKNRMSVYILVTVENSDSVPEVMKDLVERSLKFTVSKDKRNLCDVCSVHDTKVCAKVPPTPDTPISSIRSEDNESRPDLQEAERECAIMNEQSEKSSIGPSHSTDESNVNGHVTTNVEEDVHQETTITSEPAHDEQLVSSHTSHASDSAGTSGGQAGTVVNQPGNSIVGESASSVQPQKETSDMKRPRRTFTAVFRRSISPEASNQTGLPNGDRTVIEEVFKMEMEESDSDSGKQTDDSGNSKSADTPDTSENDSASFARKRRITLRTPFRKISKTRDIPTTNSTETTKESPVVTEQPLACSNDAQPKEDSLCEEKPSPSERIFSPPQLKTLQKVMNSLRIGKSPLPVFDVDDPVSTRSGRTSIKSETPSSPVHKKRRICPKEEEPSVSGETPSSSVPVKKKNLPTAPQENPAEKQVKVEENELNNGADESILDGSIFSNQPFDTAEQRAAYGAGQLVPAEVYFWMKEKIFGKQMTTIEKFAFLLIYRQYTELTDDQLLSRSIGKVYQTLDSFLQRNVLRKDIPEPTNIFFRPWMLKLTALGDVVVDLSKKALILSRREESEITNKGIDDFLSALVCCSINRNAPLATKTLEDVVNGKTSTTDGVQCMLKASYDMRTVLRKKKFSDSQIEWIVEQLGQDAGNFCRKAGTRSAAPEVLVEEVRKLMQNTGIYYSSLPSQNAA